VAVCRYLKQSLKDTVLSTYDKTLRPTDGGVADVFTLSVDFTSISDVKFAERTFEASGVYPVVLSLSRSALYPPQTASLPFVASISHTMSAPQWFCYSLSSCTSTSTSGVPIVPSIAHTDGCILDRLDTYDLEGRACSVECSNFQSISWFDGLGCKRG
jgi:hypothetical protein